MNNIEYLYYTEQQIDIIEELWKKLNKHHIDLSPYFKEEYQKMTFAKRKEKLLEKAKRRKFKIIIAKSTIDNVLIGYCVSSAIENIDGEIESLFVDKNFRGLKIGETFMIESINWMNSLNVKSKRIEVYCGNEIAIEFYKKHNFFPKYIVLEEK